MAHDLEYRLSPPPDGDFEPCSICGFRIELDKTGTPDRLITTYQLDSTPPYANIPPVYQGVIGPYAACPFCKSGNWSMGNRGTL